MSSRYFLRTRRCGELFRERSVGERRFAENEDAAGFLVEPVHNGERRPARFAMFQPVVNAFAGERRRRVRVPAGGFVNHQQMFVLKNHARNHARMKTFFGAGMKLQSGRSQIAR